MIADVGRQLQSTHLTRTTFHITPQREHVQKRALWAFSQPSTALAIGGFGGSSIY
jgi:hypothetical protein